MNISEELPIERHPWQPFLPPNAKILMLGSFPPPRARWSMDFYYPNFQNDMWRIFGLLFYNDRNHFVTPSKTFDYANIVDFCITHGIALFDTATAVKRLKANASDKFLEIVEATSLSDILVQIPTCKTLVVTGEKAAETLAAQLQCGLPSVGSAVNTMCNGQEILVYRMPSSSRAYPLALEKKAESYGRLFRTVGIL